MVKVVGNLEGESLEIDQILVKEGERRKGHGRSAVNLLKQYCRVRGVKYLVALRVQADTDTFWEKQGFSRWRQRDGDVDYRLEISEGYGATDI